MAVLPENFEICFRAADNSLIYMRGFHLRSTIANMRERLSKSSNSAMPMGWKLGFQVAGRNNHQMAHPYHGHVCHDSVTLSDLNRLSWSNGFQLCVVDAITLEICSISGGTRKFNTYRSKSVSEAMHFFFPEKCQSHYCSILNGTQRLNFWASWKHNGVQDNTQITVVWLSEP